MGKAFLVHGALSTNAFLVRTLDRKILWTCSKCHQKTFRHGDSLLDPSEDGKSLVPHPCPFIRDEKLTIDLSGSVPIALGRQRVVAKAVRSENTGKALRLCPVLGCTSTLGSYSGRLTSNRRYLCLDHWNSLTPGLQKTLADAAGRDCKRAISIAVRYISFKARQAETVPGSPRP